MAKMILQIKGWDGDRLIFERDISSHLNEHEIEIMLQRLACRLLSEEEVIRASLRKHDPDYAPLLERAGTRTPITFGYSPHYTAELKKLHRLGFYLMIKRAKTIWIAFAIITLVFSLNLEKS
jgi:hypothetical protein